MNDADYERGKRAAWMMMLSECLMNLGVTDVESQKTAWLAEREATVFALREVCAEFGDNDWPPTLHLADVVEKHLLRPLLDEREKPVCAEQPTTPVPDSGDVLGTLLDGELPLGSTGGVPCPCGGYADKVDTTHYEDTRYGCGRPRCCCGAFKCRLCGKRLVARYAAPEVE